MFLFRMSLPTQYKHYYKFTYRANSIHNTGINKMKAIGIEGTKERDSRYNHYS